MTLTNPTYIQDICYTAADDRLQLAGIVCGEGVKNFSSLRVTQQTSPGMFVDVSVGHLYLDNDQDTVAGEGGIYHVYNNGVLTLTVPANGTGSVRTDTVWVKVTDTQYIAGTSGGSVVYLPGTTTQPSDGSTYYKLATIAVPNGATTISGYPADFGATDGQITDNRSAFQSCGNTGLLYKVVLTSSTTFQIANYPGAKTVEVTCIGAGGAGGGAPGGADIGMGGGGGSGGFSQSLLLASSLAGSVTVTIGSGGTGVSNATGNAGGDTSFGTSVVAKGGSGGIVVGSAGSSAATANGGAGATITGATGDTKLPGSPGQPGLRFSGTVAIGGSGGSSVYAGGGQNLGASGDSNGNAAIANTGAGGGGGRSGSGTARLGGNGGSGLVIINVYG